MADGADTKEEEIFMVAGHLREQNGVYQMILSYKDVNGKRKTKSVSTGLKIRGNARNADRMLQQLRQTFTAPDMHPDYRKDVETNALPVDVSFNSKITANITLYAKWIEPLTISGTVSVSGTYQQDGKTVYVHDIDRATEAIVILQKIGLYMNRFGRVGD